MKRKIRNLTFMLLVVLVIVEGALAGGLFVLFSDQQIRLKNRTDELEKLKQEKYVTVENIIRNPNLTERENLDKIEKKQKNISEVKMSGWVPDWDIPNGLSTVKQYGNKFYSISPVWFYVNEDGSLKETTYTNDSEFIAYAKSNSIELIPTVSLFDQDILTKFLNNSENFDRHINAVVDQVVNNNYDGIDLDYESTYLKDKEKFFDLLETLALKLAEKNKKFVFTVMPKWGDEVIYKSLPETRRVQDYKRIADLVDEFRIMTYEFSGRESANYGPIAPLAWMEDTIKYAIYSGVPREKIMLGIHTYAYNYSERPKMETLDYYPVNEPSADKSKDAGLAYFPIDVQEVVSANNATITFEETWGEAIAEYTSPNTGEKRFIVFPNDRSLEMRKQLAAEYGIKGVVYWRIGSEGTLKL